MWQRQKLLWEFCKTLLARLWLFELALCLDEYLAAHEELGHCLDLVLQCERCSTSMSSYSATVAWAGHNAVQQGWKFSP